jgi:outer membrane protein W
MVISTFQIAGFSERIRVTGWRTKSPKKDLSRRGPRKQKQEENMKRALVFLAVAGIFGIIAAPAAAADSGWHLRVFAAGFDPDLNVTVPAENPEFIDVTAESDLGFGASLEYQFSGLLGLELGVMKASPAIVLSADDVPGYGDISLTDSMSTTAIFLDLNFHLIPNSEYFDFYLGAGIASMGYSDLHYAEPDGDTLDLDVSNDIGYSAKAGLGISLGKNSKWAAFGGLRYIWTDLEITQENAATFDFNIFSFTVGIAVSF